MDPPRRRYLLWLPARSRFERTRPTLLVNAPNLAARHVCGLARRAHFDRHSGENFVDLMILFS
jgi:hypothetical protein